MKAYEVTEYMNTMQTVKVRVAIPACKNYGKARVATAEIMQYDGQACIINPGTMLKASYTAEEVAEHDRLMASEPIEDGEVIAINGRTYRVTVLGDYSDICDLAEVA